MATALPSTIKSSISAARRPEPLSPELLRLVTEVHLRLSYGLDERRQAPRALKGHYIAPGLLALVTVLQFAENLTDRQAAYPVRGRIDWKYSLGLELSDPGFDHTVLPGFRQRLIDHGLEGT